jgi:hypothetical protein
MGLLSRPTRTFDSVIFEVVVVMEKCKQWSLMRIRSVILCESFLPHI